MTESHSRINGEFGTQRVSTLCHWWSLISGIAWSVVSQ